LFVDSGLDFQVGDIIEYNYDGVARTITSITGGFSDQEGNPKVKVDFAPALSVKAEGDMSLCNWRTNNNLVRDLRLAAGSAAIDAGNKTAFYELFETTWQSDFAALNSEEQLNIRYGFYGNPRPIDGDGDGSAEWDIGACEHASGKDVPVEPVCGNGIIETGEVCDGNSKACTVNKYRGTQQCNNLCTGWESCVTTENCEDGIQNGDETGIDCGGSCVSGLEICDNGLDDDNDCKIDEDCFNGARCDPFFDASWTAEGDILAGEFDSSKSSDYLSVVSSDGEHVLQASGELGEHRYERVVRENIGSMKAWGGSISVNLKDLEYYNFIGDLAFVGGYEYPGDWSSRDFVIGADKHANRPYIYVMGYHNNDLARSFGDEYFAVSDALTDWPDRFITIKWYFTSSNKLFASVDGGEWREIDVGSHIVNHEEVAIGWVSSYNGGNVKISNLKLYDGNCVPIETAQHTITASAGTGGSISPSGAVKINEGGDKTFSITADEGYEIADVLVDGASVGSVSTHTFDNITEDHAISASFEAKTYNLTVEASNGTVTRSPDKESYDHGEAVELTAVPDAGYDFLNWSGDAKSTDNPLVLAMDEDKSIAANFNPTPEGCQDQDGDGILDYHSQLCPAGKDICVEKKSDISDFTPYRPKSSKFSLNYNKSDDLEDISDFRIEKQETAQIYFQESLNLLKLNPDNGCYVQKDLDEGIEIENKRVFIDTNKHPDLNKKARITFYGIDYEEPKMFKDGQACQEPQCRIIEYNKEDRTLTIEVQGFSEYKVVECITVSDCEEKTCQTASCSEGTCLYSDMVDGASCDDGLVCTENDSCQSGECIGDSVDTDDSIACTIDGCDEINGITHVPDDDQCPSGQICDVEQGCISTEDGSGPGGGGASSDRTAPLISEIEASADQRSAVVSWETNEPSITWLVYGQDTDYSEEMKITDYSTSHSVDISDLSPETTYYYRIKAKDSSGNIRESAEKTFVTPEEKEDEDELRLNLIALLLKRIIYLKDLLAGREEGQVIYGIPAEFEFRRNLFLGQNLEEIQYLQMILNSYPDTRLAQRGWGSPGNETIHFGPLTRIAVIKFQNKYASEILHPTGRQAATGIVGPSTRAKLNELLGK